MRTLFCRFHIRPDKEEDSVDKLLEDVAEMCWEWAAKPRSDTELSKLLPDAWEAGSWRGSDDICVEDYNTKSGRLWKLSFINRGNDDLNISWANHIYLAYSDGDLEYSLLQEANLDEGRISQFSSPIYPPFITRDIADRFHCYIGDDAITYSFEHTNDGSKILEEVIDSRRELPILILSKLYKGSKPLINPLDISKPLTGIAKVILARDPNTRKFNQDFGEQWVTDGSIRIHWPKKDKSGLQESEYDCLYTKRAFKSRFGDDSIKLKEFLVNEICKATTLNFITSDLVNLIMEEHEELEQQKTVNAREEILHQLNNAAQKMEYQMTEINKLDEKVRTLERELTRAETNNQELKNSEENLTNRINYLDGELQSFNRFKFLANEAKGQNPELTDADFEQAIRDLGRDEEPEPEPEPEIEEFESIHDALGKAATKFGSRIMILGDALDSAKKTNSDIQPIKVFELVEFLYEEVYDKMKLAKKNHQLEGKKRFIFSKVIQNRYSDKYAEVESSSTKKRYSKEFNSKGRRFKIESGLIEIYSHLRFGTNKPLRINLTAIHEKSKPTIYRREMKKGRTVWIQEDIWDTKKYFKTLPTVVIGWCGDHLPLGKDFS